MSRLDALYRAGNLRTADHALAQSLRRLDPATDEDVQLAAALASVAIAHGHAAFDPARPQLFAGAEATDWPAPHAWQQALRDSPWLATPERDAPADPTRPLVLERGLLYLRRYREYERRLAHGLRRIAAHSTADAAPPEALFAALFPAAVGDDGGQARAAELALQKSLLLITGGPGTGKTTTIARLLLLLLAQAHDGGRAPPRIALAAPTGRAAERMAESLRHALAHLPASAAVDDTLRAALPQQASTLHRLLGSIPGSARFRHDADNPLPFDVVVVDEASMVDLPLMCKLVEAIADGTRLILLGDADQLPSVEAGDVLAAIVEATGTDAPVADALATNPPMASSLASPLHGHRVHLRRGFRQSDALQLTALADAARDGDADATMALLREGALKGVHYHADLPDPLTPATRETLLAPWRALASAIDPAGALAIAGRARVLTALREGAQGAVQLNARIEEALAGPHRSAYFHGRLLLITENSYRHGLFNGDIGVCLRDPDSGACVAWFAGGGDGLRAFHPAALPAHGGAFAMTVHKAQGSEYDTVWLQLPRQDARTLSRELVYTALTRARSALHVCASEAVLRAALARHAARISGLAWRLRDSDATAT